MNEVKVHVYTSPTCGACKMVKAQIPGSKYENLFEEKTVYGSEGKENLDFIKSMGFNSIPVIRIFNETQEEFHVGFMPITKIEEKINILSNMEVKV